MRRIELFVKTISGIGTKISALNKVCKLLEKKKKKKHPRKQNFEMKCSTCIHQTNRKKHILIEKQHFCNSKKVSNSEYG